MKNLKKIIALVLCLALAFALAACGKTDKEDDGKLKTAEAGKLIMASLRFRMLNSTQSSRVFSRESMT